MFKFYICVAMKTTLTIAFAIWWGLFAIMSALIDRNWFFSNYKARPFVSLFGRRGARIFYIVLWIILIIWGIYMLVTEGK